MEIIQHRVQSFTLDFNEFNGGDILGQSSVDIECHTYENQVFALIDFKSDLDSMSNEFKFNLAIELPFMMAPKSEITPLVLFECVERTKGYLQNIINVIFSGRPTPILPPVSFDELSDDLEKLVQDLGQ